MLGDLGLPNTSRLGSDLTILRVLENSHHVPLLILDCSGYQEVTSPSYAPVVKTA